METNFQSPVQLVNFDQVSPLYRIQQPTWLKVGVFTIAMGALGTSVYLVQASEASRERWAISGFIAVMVIVFSVAFIKQLSSGVWSVLLADQKALYILSSADAAQYLTIPWLYIKGIRLGMHGINSRGLILTIDALKLTEKESLLVTRCQNVISNQQKNLSFSIPTGIVNRSRALQELARLRDTVG